MIHFNIVRFRYVAFFTIVGLLSCSSNSVIGDDVDQVLIDWMIKSFKADTGIDSDALPKPVDHVAANRRIPHRVRLKQSLDRFDQSAPCRRKSFSHAPGTIDQVDEVVATPFDAQELDLSLGV